VRRFDWLIRFGEDDAMHDQDGRAGFDPELLRRKRFAAAASKLSAAWCIGKL